MRAAAHIGSSIVIKGDVTASEDLSIAGTIEGTLHVEGHVVSLDQGGRLDADVSAKGIVIGGHVHGTLVASERIELCAGAEVEGELTTPRLAMSDGAGLRGRVQMPSRAPGLALAS